MTQLRLEDLRSAQQDAVHHQQQQAQFLASVLDQQTVKLEQLIKKLGVQPHEVSIGVLDLMTKVGTSEVWLTIDDLRYEWNVPFERLPQVVIAQIGNHTFDSLGSLLFLEGRQIVTSPTQMVSHPHDLLNAPVGSPLPIRATRLLTAQDRERISSKDQIRADPSDQQPSNRRRSMAVLLVLTFTFVPLLIRFALRHWKKIEP